MALAVAGAVRTPAGVVATTVAVFVNEPRSMSACWAAYVEVHVVDAPGAIVSASHW